MPLQQPNPNLYPTRGFLFRESNGVEVRSDDGWSSLIQKVKQYRALTNQPAGDPQSEVFEQVCAAQPTLCNTTNVASSFPQDPSVKLGIDIGLWLVEVRIRDARNALERVSSEEASKRASICRACPKNHGWKVSCKSCDAAGKTIVAEVRRHGPEVNAEGLHGCAIFGHHNETACRLKLDPAAPREDVPDACWRAKP
jgi:hypothetical protein